VSDLAQVADVGRSAESGDRLLAPGPEVWQRIAVELGFTEDLNDVAQPRANGAVVDLGSRPRSTSSPAAEPAAAPAEPEQLSAGATGTGRAPARGRYLSLALAAGLALVAGTGLGAAWNRLTQDDEEVVATAELSPKPGWSGATGSAEVQVEDGRRWLVVTFTNPHPVAAPPQVWVRGTGAEDIINLGPIFESGQRFRVDSVNLDHFSVVDISDEPDSDPDHSGVTIVEGRLTS